MGRHEIRLFSEQPSRVLGTTEEAKSLDIRSCTIYHAQDFVKQLITREGRPSERDKVNPSASPRKSERRTDTLRAQERSHKGDRLAIVEAVDSEASSSSRTRSVLEFQTTRERR